MATKRWIGKAQAVAQVDTITVAGTWATGDTVTLTINGKDIVIGIGTDTTTAQVATAIKEAWNNNDQTGTGDHTFSTTGDLIAEFANITATVDGSVVTLTHDTAGEPFTLSVAETTAGDGTATEATATEATGPNHIDEPENWSDGVIPGLGDTVYFDEVDDKIQHGSLADTLAALIIRNVGPNFELGLPKRNQGGTEYAEYRPDYIPINTTLCEIDAANSGRIKIDFGSVQTTCTVVASGSGLETGIEAILLKGTHASNELRVQGGEVGVAIYGGELATVNTFVQLGGQVRFGDDVTLGTLTKSAGVTEVNSAIGTSLTQDSGTTTINGTGAVAQLTVNRGQVFYNTSGDLGGTTVVGALGVINFDGDRRAKTVTNPIESYTAVPVIDNFKVIGNLVVDFNQTSPGLPWGRNVRLTRGSVA